MEEKKETNLRRRRRCRGIRQDSLRAESNGLDLPVISAGGELLAVESKVDATGVSDPDDDFFPASDGALGVGGQKLGRESSAVGGDRDPGFFAGMDDDRKLARSCSGGGSRQVLRG